MLFNGRNPCEGRIGGMVKLPTYNKGLGSEINICKYTCSKGCNSKQDCPSRLSIINQA